MIRKLNDKEIKAIQASPTFALHPLYAACRCVFASRAAHLDGVLIEAEEIFVSVAYVLDSVYSKETVSPEDVETLWTSLFTDIRRIKPDASEHDKIQITHTVFAIVRKLMCHHWKSQYSETVYEHFKDVIAQETEESDKVEIERFQEKLSEFSVELDDWINQVYDGRLTEEIEKVLLSDERKSRHSDVFQPTGQTFTKTPLMLERELVIICKYLTQKRKLDEQASPDDFCRLFSGVDSEFKITWLGKEGELRDLFKTLVGEEGKKCYITPKKGYQQILRSHFRNKEEKEFLNLKGAKSIAGFAPIIDNIVFMLEHDIDKCVQEMRELIEESREQLKEEGYFEDYHPTEDLHVTKRKRYTEE